MPELLPGLNFVFGLEGETKKTFSLNYEFLKNILDSGLLVRRINLRQVIPIPGTKMYDFGDKNIRKHKIIFQRFKRKIKGEIEKPMLKKITPSGTVLKDIYTEKYDGKLTFARQLGSYPLLVGLPGIHLLQCFYDVKIVDHGYRSITGVPYPLNINKVDKETLQAIPGVGEKRSQRLIANRPFKNKKQIFEAIDDPEIGKNIMQYISFKT